MLYFGIIIQRLFILSRGSLSAQVNRANIEAHGEARPGHRAGPYPRPDPCSHPAASLSPISRSSAPAPTDPMPRDGTSNQDTILASKGPHDCGLK